MGDRWGPVLVSKVIWAVGCESCGGRPAGAWGGRLPRLLPRHHLVCPNISPAPITTCCPTSAAYCAVQWAHSSGNPGPHCVIRPPATTSLCHEFLIRALVRRLQLHRHSLFCGLRATTTLYIHCDMRARDPDIGCPGSPLCREKLLGRARAAARWAPATQVN